MEPKIKGVEELRSLMGVTQSEYSLAIRRLNELEKRKMLAEATATLIITSRRVDMLTNEKLKSYLEKCFEDDKFKPTVSFIESCIFMEHQELMEEHIALAKNARYLEKEFEMLSGQLIYYQSRNKVKAAEMMNNL